MLELFRLQLPHPIHMYRLARNVRPVTCYITRSCSAPVASPSERALRSTLRLVGGRVRVGDVARSHAPEAHERPQALPPPRRPPPQASPRAQEAQERTQPPPPPRPPPSRRPAGPGGGRRAPPAQQARRGARRAAQGSGAQAPARQGGGRAAEGEGRRPEPAGAVAARGGWRGVQGAEASRAQARPRAPPLPGGVKVALEHM